MSVTSSSKHEQTFAYDEGMTTAQFARQLKRHLRLINILLIVNAIVWTAAIIWLIRYIYL